MRYFSDEHMVALQTAVTREYGFEVFLVDLKYLDFNPWRQNDIVVDTTDTLIEQYGYNITSLVQEVNLVEKGSGQPSECTVTIMDEHGWLDPDFGGWSADGEDAPGTEGTTARKASRYMEEGQMLRVRRTSSRGSYWEFTGLVKGTPGYETSREGGQQMATITAFDRAAFYTKQSFISRPFPPGTDLGMMVHDVAINYMHMYGQEILIPQQLGVRTKHPVIQFVDESAWSIIVKILFVAGYTPRFDGAGYLTAQKSDWSGDNIIYETYDNIRSVATPQMMSDRVTSVTVLGLEWAQSKLIQDEQDIARIEITTHTMAGQIDNIINWARDQKYYATEVYVAASGSQPSWVTTSFDLFDDDTGGTWHTIPSIDRPRRPKGLIRGIRRFLGAGYRATEHIKIGDIRKTIRGKPYEWIYREIRAVAKHKLLDNSGDPLISSYPIPDIPIVYENHLVDSQDLADAIARRELWRETALTTPRNVILGADDMRLEPDDILILRDTAYNKPWDRPLWISSISKILTRGEENIELQCFLIQWHPIGGETIESECAERWISYLKDWSDGPNAAPDEFVVSWSEIHGIAKHPDGAQINQNPQAGQAYYSGEISRYGYVWLQVPYSEWNQIGPDPNLWGHAMSWNHVHAEIEVSKGEPTVIDITINDSVVHTVTIPAGTTILEYDLTSPIEIEEGDNVHGHVTAIEDGWEGGFLGGDPEMGLRIRLEYITDEDYVPGFSLDVHAFPEEPSWAGCAYEDAQEGDIICVEAMVKSDWADSVYLQVAHPWLYYGTLETDYHPGGGEWVLLSLVSDPLVDYGGFPYAIELYVIGNSSNHVTNPGGVSTHYVKWMRIGVKKAS